MTYYDKKHNAHIGSHVKYHVNGSDYGVTGVIIGITYDTYFVVVSDDGQQFTSRGAKQIGDRTELTRRYTCWTLI